MTGSRVSRLALLANPQSGAGEAEEVERLLAEAGGEIEINRLALSERERALALRPERIVVAGGDGSVACAAEIAARAGVPLAVVPVGTANDFARAMELPDDPAEAARLAVGGTRTRRLELGRSGERAFVNAASAGLSPVAARKAHGLKRLLGPLAYAAGALRAGLGTEPLRCRVRCDGTELFRGRAWQVTVASTGAFGGGAEVDADPGDGMLDVVVIEAGSRLGLVAHAYGLRAGKAERHRDVRTASGRVVEVDTDGTTGFNIDGELVDAEQLRFEVDPEAFEVVVG